MKRLIMILAMALAAVAASAHNHDDEGCECHSHEPVESSEIPQQYVQVTCPNCAGARFVIAGYDYYGNMITAPCALCQGRGWITQMVAPPPQPSPYNPSFDARTSYHAECNRTGCKCKLFVPNKTGSTTCTCGHPKSAHTKRYL